jgi:hypothetical protein
MDCWPGLLSRRFTACNRVTAFVCRDSVRKTTSNFDEDPVTRTYKLLTAPEELVTIGSPVLVDDQHRGRSSARS